MEKIIVSDMRCENCVARISKALNAEKLNFSIDLAAKTLSLEGGASEAKLALQRLDDLGFDAKLG
ncbi:MAG: heavy-metal-associated domain-containing protein [Oscillospiraceae bacterium]